ncbi:MAG: hypothetical protein WDN04_06915 [Rhodospirillales bacterium]
MIEAARQQQGGEQWAHDQTRGLHGENQAHHHAAVPLAGKFAHDGGAHG